MSKTLSLSPINQLPYPWYGGKARIAPLAWERLGNPINYIEPFFGGGAMFWLRPNYDPLLHTETVNDLDCNIPNFLRAMQSDPIQVAYWAAWPVSEADLSARHQWLTERTWGYRDDFREKMQSDPDFCDLKQAGWWVWGINSWIGSGWCANPAKSRRGNDRSPEKGVYRQRPDMSTKGLLTKRQQPYLGNSGQGVNRKRPDDSLLEYCQKLSDRLQKARVCCGDFERVLTSSVIGATSNSTTAIFLDPPYAAKHRQPNLYNHDEDDVSRRAFEWAILHGDNPKLRISFCEYDDAYELPQDWDCIAWKTHGGYANQGNNQARKNAELERVWFSPHCLKPKEFNQLNFLEALC